MEKQSQNAAKGGIAITWLGQAGFLVKNNSGFLFAIDVYLTDSCERIAGFKRLNAYSIKPEELHPDLLLASHNHPDHLDEDAVPTIMSGARTKFVGPTSTVEACLKLGVDKSRIHEIAKGQKYIFGDSTVEAVYADHGDLAPDAIGFLIETGGTKIFFTGDTAYRPDKIAEAVAFAPDIIILPINGAYGNLNEEEAAKLANDVHAKVAIPCHFWTFREHGGDPQKFADAMPKFAPECKPLFMRQGETASL
ncbi:MAG: MBL fold metallo-hydrolase [Clostridia bacterium]|nr:MBL fold metallo-hydrolase [Clostridia bacterium]MDR3643894.1 MBL fold metallo-hydrolase [Clostridia bacterium]